jgi:transposase
MRKERKHYTAEEKVAILRRYLVDKVPVSDLCEELGLQPTVFYRWQKEFFENGASAFQAKERPARQVEEKQKRIEFLEKKSVQGDLWSAASGPGQYVRNLGQALFSASWRQRVSAAHGRLSPLASTAVRAAEGRNQFGRKQSLTDLGKDLLSSNVPIPLQPWTKNSDDPLARKAFSSILKMIGVNESVARSKAEQLAFDIGQSYMPDRTMTPAERARHQLRKQIIEEGERGNWQPLYDARANGLFDAEEVRQLRYDLQLGPLAVRVNHCKYSDFMRIFSVATPEEKKELDPIRLRKRAGLLKRGKREELSAAEQP